MTITELIPLCFKPQEIEICDSEGNIYSGTIGTLLLDGWDDWDIAALSACVDGTLSIEISTPFSCVELWKKRTFGKFNE